MRAPSATVLAIALALASLAAPASAGPASRPARTGRVFGPQLAGHSQVPPSNRPTTARGYNGFNYGGYLGYRIVPAGTTPARLPTIVRWTDTGGVRHQSHLLAKDLEGFTRDVVAGGRIHSVEKATPGLRWVPAVGGDY